jgi:BirA family biotin operon repressor/biotin-[acetyl-CoA-carboxylase] ligase
MHPGDSLLTIMQTDVLQIERLYESGKPVRVGSALAHVTSTESTNDEAWKRADDDAADGLVVFAEYQSGGRGRTGRSWHAPRGTSVLCSTLLIDKPAVLSPAFLAMASPVAVYDAIRSATGLTARIKWPNDLLLSGRKVAGILIESRTRADRTAVHVIGIGINCLQQRGHFPQELAGAATSLGIESSEPIDRTAVAAALLAQLDRCFAHPERLTEADLRAQWLERAQPFGQHVRLRHRGKVFEGTVIDLDPTAALVVQLDEGSVRLFTAADTTVESDDQRSGSAIP